MKRNSIIRLAIAGVYFLSTPINAISQHYTEQELDSITVLANTCDTVGLQAMISLVNYHYYSTGDRIQHRYYLDKELECAEMLKWHKRQSLAKYHRLIFYLYSERPDSTIWAADELLEHIKDDTTTNALRKRVQAHYIKGDHYFSNEDDVEKGFIYYQEARDLALSNGFYELYLFITNDLNIYYNSEEAYDKSYAIAEEALRNVPDPDVEVNEKLFTNTRIKYVRNLRSEIEFEKAKAKIKLPNSDSSDFKLAHELGLRQVAIEKADNARHNVEALYIEMIRELEDYLPLDTLLAYGQIALEMGRAESSSSAYLYTYHGCNLIKAGRYIEAKSILLKAIELSKKREGLFMLLQKSYDGLVKLHLALNENRDAQEAYEEFKIYSDSVYIRKNRTAVDAVESKYIITQKEAENQIITERAEQLRERLKLLAVLGVLLLLLAASAFAFYLQKRRSAQRLTQMMDTKDKIFAILAHDLKGPIAALNNLTDKVKYLINTDNISLLDEMMSQIDHRMNGLNENLNNVLLWAISETSLVDLKPENVTLYTEVEDVLALYGDAIEGQGLRIRNDISPSYSVMIDRKVIKTIIRNLVSNAIKFSQNKGEIEVYLDQDKKSGMHILKIKDNGYGLSHDGKNAALKKKKTGSGIGLKICKELASKSGIILELIPNPDGGAIGVVKIPTAA